MRAASQSRLDLSDRRAHARIVRVEKAHFHHQKHASVQMLALEGFGEGLSPLGPGAVENDTLDLIGFLSPVLPVWGSPTCWAMIASRSSAAQHIRPRSCGRARVNVAPTCPRRACRKGQRLAPHRSRRKKSDPRRWRYQATVEERLRDRKHDIAVTVVLKMLVSLVADAHGTHAAVAGQGAHDLSGSWASSPTP